MLHYTRIGRVGRQGSRKTKQNINTTFPNYRTGQSNLFFKTKTRLRVCVWTVDRGISTVIPLSNVDAAAAAVFYVCTARPCFVFYLRHRFFNVTKMNKNTLNGTSNSDKNHSNVKIKSIKTLRCRYCNVSRVSEENYICNLFFDFESATNYRRFFRFTVVLFKIRTYNTA